ncbi:MAG: hypothetical protein ACE141_18465 [Bryobacteraceae bacterium]
MLRPTRPKALHPPGLIRRLIEQVRGREQRMVRAGDDLPILLLSFPRGKHAAAEALETAWTHLLRALKPETLAPYADVLRALPAMVVVVLRPSNVCGCLGHHHPPGTESRLTRRLQGDLGRAVGEIDLAYESIRAWEPQPLSSLAASGMGGRLAALRFQAALLSVLLHELEHLARGGEGEHTVRTRSNRFYATVMEELVASESGAAYGMASRPPPRP